MTFKHLGPLAGAALVVSAVWAGAPAVYPAVQKPQTPVVRVQSVAELRQALANAQPGTRILIAPGTYQGGFQTVGLRGVPGKPIIVAGADPNNPPVFAGGGTGWHLPRASYVTLSDLTFRGQSGVGLNIDDGGEYDHPARGITLRNITVSEVGPTGNHDGIKLSGVDEFRLDNCRLSRISGQSIDMVGCHRGVIENCRIGPLDGAEGIQAKGGTENVTVRRCHFENAGLRGVNIGGSTGLEFFRPPLSSAPKPYAEARNITVEGFTFVGGDAPIAFAGADGALVRYNTFYRPRRWAIRILQETREPGFVACRNGVFTDNIVVWQSAGWSERGVNIGDATEPGSFRFARNVWYCEDKPEQSQPGLPTPEVAGVYGKDPRLAEPTNGNFQPAKDGPGAKVGAFALPRPLPAKSAR